MRPLVLLMLLLLPLGCEQTVDTPDDDDDATADDDDATSDDDDATADDDDATVDDDDATADDDDTVDDDDVADDDDIADDDDAANGGCDVADQFTCASPAIGDTAADAAATSVVDDYDCANFTMSGPEVAYEFVAPSAGEYTVTLGGLQSDLDLFYLDGSSYCDPTACLEASNAGGNNDEHITVTAAADERFVFVIDGYDGASSTYSLDVSCGSGDDDDATGDDDDVADDDDIADDDDATSSGTCVGGDALTCTDPLAQGDNTGEANNAESYSCVGYNLNGPEVVYEFVAPSGGDYTIVLDDLTADLDLFVLDGSSGTCDPSACMDSSNAGGNTAETIELVASANEVFYVVVDGWNGAESSFSIQIACGGGDDDDATGDDDDSVPTSSSFGDLVITEILHNPSGADGLREWFEILNTTANPIQLDGWTISDDGVDSHTITGGKVIAPGALAVLGASESPVDNGGANVDYAYGTDISLANAPDEIHLHDPSGTLIDSVAYDDGPNFPDTEGYSQSLDPASMNASSNNFGSLWCESPGAVFGTGGDRGTPGVANPVCAPGVTDSDGDGSPDDLDCNDNNPTIYPFATEIACDDIDQNCDGVDFDPDYDGDGYGSCDDDCDDGDDQVNPGVPEVLGNGIDDDCNGQTDEQPLSCDVAESEANDSYVTADPMALNTSMCGTIVAPGDADVFALVAPDFTRITVNIDARVDGSPLDSYVRVLDSGGNELLSNDDDPSFSFDSYLQFTVIAGGTFYVEVTAYLNNSGSAAHTYELYVDSGDACDVSEVEPNGNPGLADATVVGGFTCGDISGSTDEDWFAFVGQAGQTLRFDVFAQAWGSDLGAQIELKDALGNQLAIAEPGPWADPSLVYTFTATDTYYAVIESDWYIVNTSGPYTMLIWEP